MSVIRIQPPDMLVAHRKGSPTKNPLPWAFRASDNFLKHRIEECDLPAVTDEQWYRCVFLPPDDSEETEELGLDPEVFMPSSAQVTCPEMTKLRQVVYQYYDDPLLDVERRDNFIGKAVANATEGNTCYVDRLRPGIQRAWLDEGHKHEMQPCVVGYIYSVILDSLCAIG